MLQSPPIPPEGLKVPQIKEGQSLQQRHQSATPFSTDDIRDLRALLGVSFRAILKFELAKKRGDAAGAGK